MSYNVSCLYVLMEDLPKTWYYFIKYGILMIAGLVFKTHPLKKFGLSLSCRKGDSWGALMGNVYLSGNRCLG